ncbi:MAG TPA: EF-hand domain-containing protein [Erythrobacter sp.]|nr:EF-hand domain-containing protein [Erythrobacter sp.]
MKKTLTALTALAIAAFSQVSLGQGAPTFEQLDTNSDGKIDAKETSAWFDLIKGYGINVGPDAASFLKAIDGNGDGAVDKEEFAKLPTSA